MCEIAANTTPAKYAVAMLTKMQRYREQNDLCDIVLVVGVGDSEKRIPAHRNVLSAASDYFEAMFTGALQEATQSEVRLNDVDADDLESLVRYCYSGQIKITATAAQTLLSTAAFLQLNEVVAACSEFLEKHLSPENCVGIALFADQQSCPKLLRKANFYISEHLAEVSSKEEFLLLDRQALTKLILSDDFVPASEQCVFNSLISWIKYDETNRKEYLTELLNLLELTSFPAHLILESISPFIGLEMKTREGSTWKQKRPREFSYNSILALGFGKHNVTIKKYYPSGDKWTHWNILDKCRSCFGAAVFENKLFIMGGRDDAGNNLSDCLAMDLKAKPVSLGIEAMTVSSIGNMRKCRSQFAVAVLDGLLYAVGGVTNGKRILDSVERYSPVTSTWTEICPMSSKRNYPAAAVLGKLLFVVGGEASGRKHLNTVECYNPERDEWTARAPMNVARWGVGVATVNGTLYAIGGINDKGPLKTVERYDSNENKWTQICSLNIGRYASGCVALENRIFAIGGIGGADTVEEYNISTDKWTLGVPIGTNEEVLYTQAVRASSL